MYKVGGEDEEIKRNPKTEKSSFISPKNLA
jgi:hypothetical protein